MRTNRIVCQPPRVCNVIESGPTFNSTTILNFNWGSDFRVPTFSDGFKYTFGVCLASSLWGLAMGGIQQWCLKGGRGGKRTSNASNSTNNTNNNTNNNTTLQVDKDQPKISELIKKVDAFDKKPTETEAKSLYKTLKELSEKPIDDVNKQTNIDTYKHLLEHITRIANEKGWKLDGNSGPEKVKPKDKVKPNEDDPFKDFDKISWNDGATAPDKNTLDNMDKGNNSFATADEINNNTKFKKIHDTGARTTDVNASKTDKSGKVSYISGQKGEGGFPLYLIANDNGGSYKYKLLKVVDNRAIYTTPSQDKNKNVYVLLKDSSGDLILWQDKKFSGHNKGDTQNK